MTKISGDESWMMRLTVLKQCRKVERKNKQTHYSSIDRAFMSVEINRSL